MKIALGTAQFGMDYGLSNTRGRADKYEVSNILQYAYDHGICLIDTASSYGDSENVLGEVTPNYDWRIVTKTPHFTDYYIDSSHVKQLSEFFSQSLINLRRKYIYGLLLHSGGDLLKPHGELLFKEMAMLKSSGLVRKIGVSVYSGNQIEMILDKYDIDLIQLPINILDQKLLLDGCLKKIKDKNIEIHARSVFLQGLLLMEKDLIPPYFSPIVKNIEGFYKLAKELSFKRLELALRFALGVKEIDKVIVGVNTVKHLKEIVNISKSGNFQYIECENISVDNINYTNPSLWKI